MKEGFNKNSAKGMRDFLPAEKAFREQLLSVIRKTYASFGFCEIETPCVEDINNLLSKQGGENEKLIYKILKRGEQAEGSDAAGLCDLGLRFDLTVPLARYYANNGGNLPQVFKAVQIGNVWRAERPQKGRFRQFVQCDIDIIGDETKQAETELILASYAALKAIGLDRFCVVINDRRILKGLAAGNGIEEEKFDSAFIALDKLDKIGRDKVVEELTGHGIAQKSAQAFVDSAVEISDAKDGLGAAEKLLANITGAEVFKNLNSIIQTARNAGGCDIRYCCTLVRGMGYYTGPIFEIVSEDFGSSIGGGGRYDNMLGKFTGKDVPACGISIGFERITAVLSEKNAGFGSTAEKAVIFIEQDADDSVFVSALKKAEKLREQGKICLVSRKNKNFAFQKAQLSAQNYNEFFKLGNNGELMPV